MSRPARVLIPIVIAAALGGSLVSAHYYRLGLALSHYDPAATSSSRVGCSTALPLDGNSSVPCGFRCPTR
jgi:hypothetical protein